MECADNAILPPAELRPAKNSCHFIEDVIGYVSILVVGWSIFFAPGHRQVFGNWNDPFSVLIGIAVVVALAANTVALCLTGRRERL